MRDSLKRQKGKKKKKKKGSTTKLTGGAFLQVGEPHNC